ncbi:GIY-YIG nuclease family protein [Scytonema sp. UIC 10036]|uniref:GIY-YIG nuclease family protein n=1 Tax=Scytonema sp. UIC 10036 TaxID=2304196 RepID=UPI0012DAE7A9|nr:GIY-YIG nuclease family protein [Scytonema sp. UIC 10036]MUG94848.1 GIY-YIG nuclease family protein [Scytonema sp. UIC 10036]
MWLKYGVDKNGALVGIEDVPKGKTPLQCPYCGGSLTAKKGKIKEHHFAHTEETCRAVAATNREIPVLPLYENFNLQLSGKEFDRLKLLWREFGSKNQIIMRELIFPSFLYRELLQEKPGFNPSVYEFTKLGKIPFGGLPLVHFNQVQEPLLLKKLSDLEEKTERAQLINLSNLPELLVDLRIYRTQLKRILSTTLYYLKIQCDGKILHKIGVTQRSVDERIEEIQRELKKYFQIVSIEVLGSWVHRGNVEKYFKHRYQEFNHPIGNLTEYYNFNTEDAKIALRDLQQMKPKVLSQAELNILQT